MAFACRNCREKFNLSRLLTDANALSDGYSVVSTQCGHLFHFKCLEGALTNQKLLHARHGTGPLRRLCPVARCNSIIPSEESIIKINFNGDDDFNYRDETDSEIQDTESKLVKKVQTLTSEKDKLLKNLEKAGHEVDSLRSALDDIKFDLSDILSFLKDDYMMKKGDLIFYVTRDQTYAPGKILEIRKKPGENKHYAIVKLDTKTKISGVGQTSVERDTLILPLSDLTTFKSFFKTFFEKFQTKFDSLIMDLNTEIQEISSPVGLQPSNRSTAYYRSTRKLSRSTSKPNIGVSSLNSLDELSSEIVDSVHVAAIRKISQPLVSPTQDGGRKSTKITRSRTINYGANSEPKRIEKRRSMSWVPARQTSYDSISTIESNDCFSDLSTTTMTEEEEAEVDVHNEFIRDGEKVIWFDPSSEFRQVGVVAAVCEYMPCAIVNFVSERLILLALKISITHLISWQDEHPEVKHKFKYRSVHLDELFPYDLASVEDKRCIAEEYGKLNEFMEEHPYLFEGNQDDEPELVEYTEPEEGEQSDQECVSD